MSRACEHAPRPPCRPGVRRATPGDRALGRPVARRQHEHARARRRRRRRRGLRRAGGRPAPSSRASTRARCSWCSQSRVAASRCSGRRLSAWTSRAARPELAAASRVGHRAAAAPRGPWRSPAARPGTKTTGATSGCTSAAARSCRGRRPSPSHPRQRQAAVDARRGVVGVPLEPARQALAKRGRPVVEPAPRRASCSALGGNDARDDRRRRRAQPAAVRDPLRQPQAQPAGGSTPSAAQARCIARCTRWALVERHVAGALARDLDDEPRPLGHRGHDVRRPRPRGPGRASRSPGRGWRCSRARAPRTPTADRRASAALTVSPRGRAPARRGEGVDRHPGPATTSEPSALRSAHCGSLRPWPVTVQTMRGPARHEPGLVRREQAGDGRGGRRLDEDALAGGQQAVRGEDLLVGDRLDAAAGLVAGRLGLLPRGGVADADRGGDGLGVVDGVAEHDRRGAGGLEAPHPRGPGGRAGAASRRRGVLAVAPPVGGDVAGVADRQAVDVGRVAERVDDLERRGLLALDAGRVDRVDQLDRVGLGELAGERRGSRRSCRRPAAASRRARSPG